jgi:hypothetical protein
VEDVADLGGESLPVGVADAETALPDVALDDLHAAAGGLAGGAGHATLHQSGHLRAAVQEAVGEAAADETGVPGQEHVPLQHGAAPYYTL